MAWESGVRPNRSRGVRMLPRFLPAALLAVAFASPARALTIWCWGDSIADQYSDNLATLRPDDVVLNFGAGGEDTRQSLARARQTIAILGHMLPDVVVITLGTNDDYHVALGTLDETAEEAAGNIATIRQMFLDAGVPHVLVTTTLVAPFSGNRAEWLREFRARLRRLRPWVEFRFDPKFYDTDGIHPNDAGEVVLALRVSHAIDRVQRSRSPRTARTRQSIVAAK